jgi:hypothetical protein
MSRIQMILIDSLNLRETRVALIYDPMGIFKDHMTSVKHKNCFPQFLEFETRPRVMKVGMMKAMTSIEYSWSLFL